MLPTLGCFLPPDIVDVVDGTFIFILSVSAETLPWCSRSLFISSSSKYNCRWCIGVSSSVLMSIGRGVRCCCWCWCSSASTAPKHDGELPRRWMRVIDAKRFMMMIFECSVNIMRCIQCMPCRFMNRVIVLWSSTGIEPNKS